MVRGGWELEEVERDKEAKGFKVLPKRWIVERTFGWLRRDRRLARDYERKVQTSETFIEVATIRLILPIRVTKRMTPAHWRNRCTGIPYPLYRMLRACLRASITTHGSTSPQHAVRRHCNSYIHAGQGSDRFRAYLHQIRL